MSFRKSILIEDEFNRASLGSAYQTIDYLKYDLPVIVDNDAVTSNALGRWASGVHETQLPVDHYAEIELKVFDDTLDDPYAWVVCRYSGRGITLNSGYFFFVYTYLGSVFFELYRWDPPTSAYESDWVNEATGKFWVEWQQSSLPAGTKIGIEALRNYISAYIDTGSGKQYLLWGTDDTYPNQTGAVLGMESNTPETTEITGFQAGDLHPVRHKRSADRINADAPRYRNTKRQHNDMARRHQT